MNRRVQLVVDRRCNKVCYKSRAKARKKLKWFSGRGNYRQRDAYPCPFPEHKGVWHLTSQRQHNVEAKKQAVEQDRDRRQQGGDQEGDQEQGDGRAPV